MSWLIRNGTGRNNIIWGGGNTTSGNYLRRTGTSRNNISYVQISSNGTWNILERTSTGRNNIRWNNLTFNFFSFSQYPLNSNESEPIYFWSYKGIYMYKLKSYLSDGYNLTYSRYNGGNTIARYTLYIALNGSGNQNAKNLASSLNDDIVLEFLTEKWIGFSDVVVNKNSVIKEVLFDHFQKYHARKNEEGWNLLNNYFYDWKPTVNAIVKERKETRDPKVAFGIAMSIASSMLNQSDTYFYIGEEAAK